MRPHARCVPRVATKVSGAELTQNGLYTKSTQHKDCNGKPVYQLGGESAVLLFSDSAHDWNVGPNTGLVDCSSDQSLLYLSTSLQVRPLNHGSCPESPDGLGCMGKWDEKAVNLPPLHGYSWTGRPAVLVAGVGGLGCRLPSAAQCDGIQQHGACVGRAQGEPSESSSCVCDSGWSGANCDHDPCAGVDCTGGHREH